MSLNGVIAANVDITRNEIEITKKIVGIMIKVFLKRSKPKISKLIKYIDKNEV